MSRPDPYQRKPGLVRQPCAGQMAFVSALAASRHRLRDSESYRCNRCSFFHLGVQPAAKVAGESLFNSDAA